MDDLKHSVARILEERRLQQEVSYYRSRESRGTRIEALLGSCAAMVKLRATLRRLAQIAATSDPPTVLIQGETGTGKGLVARVLHYNGPRSGRPFIQVNCAAIPESLVEAELFGYRAGAFTDARTSKAGLFQAADGGTLFLDEISSLPLVVQAKILKALEEKTVRQLGSSGEQPVNLHVIAATNRDLTDEVQRGSFREDLLYRVQVAPLYLPPLRERGDDVLLLARAFLNDVAARYRLPPIALSRDAEEALLRHRWPGNVRELSNALDRAALFSEARVIDAAALGLPASSAGALTFRRHGEAELEIEIPDEGIRFEEVERAMIIGGLRKARGRQAEAARLLGLTRDTLRYRIEKFRIAGDSQLDR
jgi:DNA-binding NtrC family response regulator